MSFLILLSLSGATSHAPLRHEKILKMEDRVLGEKFITPETASSTKESIKAMSNLNADASHQAKALKLVFRRIATKKTPLTDLICRQYCGGYHTISSLTYGLYCPSYGSSYYAYCVACNTQRTTNTPTCLQCKARFK